MGLFPSLRFYDIDYNDEDVKRNGAAYFPFPRNFLIES